MNYKSPSSRLSSSAMAAWALLCSVLFFNNTFAQEWTSSELSFLRQEIDEKTDPFLTYKTKEVPDSLMENSMIILDFIELFLFKTRGSLIENNRISRELILINDKAAVEYFSRFPLESNQNKYRVNSLGRVVKTQGRFLPRYTIRIIKKEGEQVEVNLDKLRPNARGEVAIPNLEIGDILDFAVKVTEQVEECFDPEFTPVADDSPMLNSFKRYELRKGFYLSFDAEKSDIAPVLNEAISKPKKAIYDLEFSAYETLDLEPWEVPYMTRPYTASQVCYCHKSNKSRTSLIVPEEGKIIRHSTPEQRKKAILYRDQEKVDSYNSLNKRFKKKYDIYYSVQDLSKVELMERAYNFFRYYLAIGVYMQPNYHSAQFDSRLFSQRLMLAAADMNIEAEFVATTHKYLADIDEIIMRDELISLFRFKDEEGNWHYISPSKPFYRAFDLDEVVMGQKAITHNWNTLQDTIILPSTTSSENFHTYQLEATVDMEKNIAQMESVQTLTGNERMYSSYFVLHNTEYHNDLDKSRDDGHLALDPDAPRTPYDTYYRSLLEPDSANKAIDMEHWLRASFDVDEYISFDLLSSGLALDNDTMIIKDVFTVSEVAKKAGKNIILDLGKMIPTQASLTETEKTTRHYDAQFLYPRKFLFDLRIELPEGYEAYKLESLHVDVENEIGRTKISSASTEPGFIIISVAKEYFTDHVKAENWSELIAFLEPGMNLNQAQIVLKPTQAPSSSNVDVE